MQFKEILGQEEVKQRLVRSVREGRISHAQLFAGPEGSGALLLAIAYAQYLACEQPQEEDSCGSCSSCRKYAKLSHPDLHFSYPFIAAKKESVAMDYIREWREALLEEPYLSLERWMQRLSAENKQPNINIAECHAIIQRLSLKPFESSFKVMIIWLPEYLREVGNSLLKLIEEPSPNTLFLLVSEHPEQLLTTLLSRTQLVRIPRLPEALIARYLAEHGESDEELARQAASLSEGNLARAIELAAGEQSRHGELFMDWMRICYQSDGLKLAEHTEELAKLGRENQKNFLRYGLSLVEESLRQGLGLPERKRGAEKEFAQRFSGQLNLEKAEKLSGVLEEAVFHIERNANPRILFLDVSLQISRLLNARLSPGFN